MGGGLPELDALTRRRMLAGMAALGAGALLPRGLVLAARAAAAEPVWLAGDLHVHTTYSHDVWAGPGDDNTDLQDAYTYGYTVAQRFAQAHARGLDFLAITDHNDVRSQADPGFGADGVIGLPAYECSLRGHAQMLGARRVYAAGDQSLEAVGRLAQALRRDRGLFQINHPAGRAVEDSLLVDDPSPCDASCPPLDWAYGLDVVPDTLEVWNAASPPNGRAEALWEDFLSRGLRIAGTGGSDSHWQSTNALQGPGQPTTWVRASGRDLAGVLDGLRRGRTAISAAHPAGGGPLLLLEADPRRDGSFSAGIGDAVRPGTPLRVRVQGTQAGGTVRLRANGRALPEQRLEPGGEVRLAAPGEPGWIRAGLIQDLADAPAAIACMAIPGESILASSCRDGRMLTAMTSPLYLLGDPGAR